MNKYFKIFFLVFSIFLIAGSGISAQNNDTNFSGNINLIISNIEKESIDAIEKEGILLMREEEKLARDVYLALYDKWNLKIFYNIAQSEKTHMEAMKLLLERYGIIDPVGEDIVGTFENDKLQKLYNELVAKGSQSLEQALSASATVEELDIYDLKELLGKTDNDDIKIVYQNLLKGSRNHLRSFNKQLERNGITYSSQYLSQKEYDALAASPQEKGGAISNPDFVY